MVNHGERLDEEKVCAVKREINYCRASCQETRGFRLICEVLRGDRCVIRQGSYITAIMAVITCP